MDEKPLITAKELEELFGKVDFQQLVKDELVAEIKAELKKHEDKYLTDIIIQPEVYKSMKYNRPMNFLEKLEAGRYWFWECLLEWIWCMTHPEDTGGDFFCHINCNYVAYEEETYYE